MRLSLDTNILVRAFMDDEPDYRDVTSLVSLTNSQLCLDFGRVIEKEYRNNLDRSLGFQKWFKRLRDRNGVYLCNGKIPKRHRSKLGNMGCHEASDHVFIGAAFHTDKVLLSEDSDVGKGIRGTQPPHCDALKYLTNVMGIKVLDVCEALDFLQS
ncbi:MAG: hypothetical protein KJ606_08695 [Chloroflexi bacterium]|nr:hypothetical protein [Chloroflexota bacterium]